MINRKDYWKKRIFFCILLVGLVRISAYAQSSVQLKRFPQGAFLKNSHIKVILRDKGDSGIERKFFARKKNGAWKLVMQGFNPHYSGTTDSAVQLWNMKLNPYRHLITGIPGSILSNEELNKSDPFVVIKMNHRGAVITEKISLHGEDDYFHIEVKAVFPDENPKLDYLLSSYKILNNDTPDFVHTPGVKFDDPRSGAGRDQITGDRAFLAPAVIFQQGENFVSLVPDLNAANNLRVISKDARRHYIEPTKGPFNLPFIDSLFTMPEGIDLNMHSGLTPYPVISFGLMDANIGFHTRFVRNEYANEMVRTLDSNKAGYAFDLFVSASMTSNGYQQISQHQWKQYGSPIFNKDYHLAMPIKEYVKLVTKTIFSPIRDSVGNVVKTPGGKMDSTVVGYQDNGSWLEWTTNGVKMGGFRCSAPFWDDVINNSPFWNQARAAVGMYYWGKEMNDSSLIEKAKEVINFCLSAPRNTDGLFSTVFSARNKTWGIGWTDPPHGKNVLFLRNSECYEIPTLCKTGAHLLDYYLRAEKNQRIIDYLQPFANWLLKVLDSRGIVPSYVTTDMKPSSILYESAQPAAAMWFLAEMYNATQESKFLNGAKKIAIYLEKEIIPSAKWIDMEQYISCGAKPYSYQKDYWQRQWFRGTLCTIWATEGFAALHRATYQNRWLIDGEKCADYLSFSQCVWKPHYIYTANPFGGFVSDNSDDANMMDQREAEIVKPFIYLGKALGRQDLIERAVAAAEASCTLIINPRHVRNNIFRFPLFYPNGVAPENIDHEGLPQCPMRTHPLWGEGSAVFTGLSEAYRSLGGLFIDPVKNIVVGVDGIKINSVIKKGHTLKIEAESFLSSRFLIQPWEYMYTSNIEIEKNSDLIVRLNGINVGKNNNGKLEIRILPGGDIVINK
jgi:hypothetical protein